MKLGVRSAWALPVLSLILALGAGQAMAAPAYTLTALLAVPASADNNAGGKFTNFDNGAFDGDTQTYYLADRSNASIDIYSATDNAFVGRIGGTGNVFTGTRPAPPAPVNNSVSGPNGIIPAEMGGRHLLYVGDGDNKLKGFDLSNGNAALPGTPAVAGPASDGRTNEGAFSPVSNRVLIVTSDTAIPYATILDSTTNAIVAKTLFDGTDGTPKSTGGLKSSIWDPETNQFYLALGQVGGAGPGAVVAINPMTGKVAKTYDLAAYGFTACAPVGVVHGPGRKLLLGCSAASQAIVLDTAAKGGDGAAIGFPQVSGVDQVAFDAKTGLYFLAARDNPGGSVLGIIDGGSDTFVQNLPTAPNSHSVAVDPVSSKVFVPFAGIVGNTVCPDGCIAVFSPAAAQTP